MDDELLSLRTQNLALQQTVRTQWLQIERQGVELAYLRAAVDLLSLPRSTEEDVTAVKHGLEELSNLLDEEVTWIKH